jgi:hypothetical protein
VTGFEFPHAKILRGTRDRPTAETSLPVTIFPAATKDRPAEPPSPSWKCGDRLRISARKTTRGPRDTLTAETSLPVTIFPAATKDRPAEPPSPSWKCGDRLRISARKTTRGPRDTRTAETSLPVTIFPAASISDCLRGSSQLIAREFLEPERKPHYSSRNNASGLTDKARCAGIHVANNPSNPIATTTPASTNGSRGVA